MPQALDLVPRRAFSAKSSGRKILVPDLVPKSESSAKFSAGLKCLDFTLIILKCNKSLII